MIETWIEYKRENEIDAAAAPPAPVGVLPLLRHLGTWTFRISHHAGTTLPMSLRLGPAIRHGGRRITWVACPGEPAGLVPEDRGEAGAR